MRHTAYRRLFAAQVVALLGTGLLTVALSLLAYEVAPGSAGVVVGTALSIKMIAYVAMAPALTALTAGMPPRVVLVGSDVVRVLVAATLPWVDQVWQVYVLIFILQAASATFNPTYQALLPTVLPRMADYTRALSYSRLAYDLEAVASPLVAAAALLVVSYHGLFAGTAVGFFLSAVLVLRSRQGLTSDAAATASFRQRMTAGVRMFAARRQLRALLALDLAAAGGTAMVLVNTVVVTRQTLGREGDSVAVVLGVFGAGSMVAALALPRVLAHRTERQVMLSGAIGTTVAMVGAAFVTSGSSSWPGLLVVWFLLGAAGSVALTPGGQVINRCVSEAERPPAFAAHFSLSHACYLLAYPVAGWVGSQAGLPVAAAVLAVISAAATIVAAITWSDQQVADASPDRSASEPSRHDDCEP
ncbi:MFS transporter [Aeromicrobium endophyticum]|uniref:MFS transporter n=1 Tax=Aeromicrobium endophyticum TaxID=2292704 RepID=A0A371P3H9_9ACTN|nr:MFS transporter [Aeromicrobium endophyticum]